MGIAFTAVALPLFLLNLNTYGERLPFNGMIVLCEETTPRFIGFARDPNFYGLAASISLVTLPFATRIPLKVRWLGAALLITAIFFTGSRLLPVSLLVGTAFLVGALLMMRQTYPVRQLLLTLVPGFLIALLMVPLWFQIPDQSSSLGSRLLDRYSLGTNTPRTDLWWQTVESFGPREAEANHNFTAQAFRIMLGNGLRSNQENLNGQYSHNTYLDLIGETGIIGSRIWLAVTGLVTAQGFRAVRRNPTLTPWLAVWLTPLLFFYGFSLLFAPYYWFIAAVICGLSFRETNAASHDTHAVEFRSVPLGSGS